MILQVMFPCDVILGNHDMLKVDPNSKKLVKHHFENSETEAKMHQMLRNGVSNPGYKEGPKEPPPANNIKL